MKKMILPILLFFILLGCNDDENNERQEPSIYGTWQLVESGEGIPALGGGSATIPNGYTISFVQNLKFTSSCSNNGETLNPGFIAGVCAGSNGENMSGDFIINQDIIKQDSSISFITLTFNEIVHGFANGFGQERTFQFHFENQYLVLANRLCIEGCYDKLGKIAEGEVNYSQK